MCCKCVLYFEAKRVCGSFKSVEVATEANLNKNSLNFRVFFLTKAEQI